MSNRQVDVYVARVNGVAEVSTSTTHDDIVFTTSAPTLEESLELLRLMVANYEELKARASELPTSVEVDW